jgi:hypothetical protein
VVRSENTRGLINLFIHCTPLCIQNQGCSVNIETRLQGWRTGLIPSGGSDGIFSHCHCIQTPIQWVLEALTAGVKQLGHDAACSSLSNAEVRNVWSYTKSLLYVFMAWYFVKHRDNFTFTFHTANI